MNFLSIWILFSFCFLRLTLLPVCIENLRLFKISNAALSLTPQAGLLLHDNQLIACFQKSVAGVDLVGFAKMEHLYYISKYSHNNIAT